MSTHSSSINVKNDLQFAAISLRTFQFRLPLNKALQTLLSIWDFIQFSIYDFSTQISLCPVIHMSFAGMFHIGNIYDLFLDFINRLGNSIKFNILNSIWIWWQLHWCGAHSDPGFAGCRTNQSLENQMVLYWTNFPFIKVEMPGFAFWSELLFGVWFGILFDYLYQTRTMTIVKLQKISNLPSF